MNVVDKAAGVSAAIAPGGGAAGGGLKSSLVGVSGATPFAGLVHSLANQTESLGKQAGEAVTGLLSGQGVEIHDVMIAEQKASVSFELALQVRNKAVAAYQQMMGMQF